MNYPKEINMFYDWLETNHLPKSAIALWHALMHVNNKANWVDTFAVAISTLEFKTGFRRSELFEARNILAQKGRIEWSQRGGNLSANYSIIPFCVHNTDANQDAIPDANQDAIPDTNPTQTGTINKLNYTRLNKTKQEEKEKIKKEKNNFDLSFLENDFADAFLEWIAYKQEKGKMYKGQISLKTCYNQLKKLAKDNPQTATEIVNQSIANNWDGLFEIKNFFKSKETESSMPIIDVLPNI